jgi:hypothetical protein
MAYSSVCAVCMSSNFIGNSLLYMRPCFKVIWMSYVLKMLCVIVEYEVINKPSEAVGNCLGRHQVDNALTCH